MIQAVIKILLFLFASRKQNDNSRPLIYSDVSSAPHVEPNAMKGRIHDLKHRRSFKIVVVITVVAFVIGGNNILVTNGGLGGLMSKIGASALETTKTATLDAVGKPKEIELIPTPSWEDVSSTFNSKCEQSPGTVEFSGYTVPYSQEFSSPLIPDQLEHGLSHVEMDLTMSGVVVLASSCSELSQNMSYDRTTGILKVKLPRPRATAVEIDFNNVEVSNYSQGKLQQAQSIASAINGGHTSIDQQNAIYATATDDLKKQANADEGLITRAQSDIADYYQSIVDIIGNGLSVEVTFTQETDTA